MNEQDVASEKELNEVKINNLPDKEFKVGSDHKDTQQTQEKNE